MNAQILAYIYYNILYTGAQNIQMSSGFTLDLLLVHKILPT